jgi:DNA-binding MarR family transcriptional regulator
MKSATDKKRIAAPARAASEQGAAPIAGYGGKLDLGPLPNLLGYALRRAQLAVFADFHASFAELNLKPAQFSVLVLLDANPGCKQSEAAVALGIMQPNFVALMDELESRDLARRAPAKTDRRSHALELTAKGRTLLQRAQRVAAEHEVRSLHGLSPAEARQLFDLLHRVELSVGGGATSGK